MSSKSLGYYIKINRISIEGTPVALPLKIGLVKLSTILPYTTLRSDIYKALITSFSEATRKIHRVNTVKPFSLCLKSSAIRSIGTGFRVPKINLETESGKNWTIYGGNSMKFTGNATACFAFVDGGLDVKDPIVIGTFQMENNFMSFDLQNQRLGFSSSLLAHGTSCSGFNFTRSY
ncbi:aspartic peptidase A1 family protein [Tanacetum coccineum]